MRDATRGDAFARVDASGEPATTFVDYLDAVTAIDAARMYKRRSYERLRIVPGARVLDVGCGVGDDVRAIAELVGESGRVVGVDLSEQLIAEARRRTRMPSNIDFTTGDTHDLRFDDETFDASRVDRTLQHLADPAQAVRELVRVTRSGGRVVASEPDWDTIAFDAANVPLTRTIARVMSDDRRNPWMGRRLYPLFVENGLRELSFEGFVIPVFDFEQADQLTGIVPAAAIARERGEITSIDEAAWLADLRERSAHGRFFAAVSLYVVAGTKP